MDIIKKSGRKDEFKPDKILHRIKNESKGLSVNCDELFLKTISSLKDTNLTTEDVDNVIVMTAASYATVHPDYSILAARIAITRLHRQTDNKFHDVMKSLKSEGIIRPDFIKKYLHGVAEIESAIDYSKDFVFDFFGWSRLSEMYLLKINGKIVERPQHMYMRVAIELTNTIEDAIAYYKLISSHKISPPSPILFNSGTNVGQLASCELHYNNGDSKDGLDKTYSNVTTSSSKAAGIGLAMHNIRSKESEIGTTGGRAGGLLKYVKIINEGLRFYNQRGKRKGSAAIYLEPWHKDIIDFLEMTKKTGSEELRARDIFTALWTPDNFMKAVEENGDYYLFCPNDIKKAGLKPLDSIYGSEFEYEYDKAVSLGLGKKVNARDIFKKVLESQIETGVPYMTFKDNANLKTNHQNIGTIRSSNLCSEIFQATNESSVAVCTLTSIPVQKYVKGDDKKTFDFEELHQSIKYVVLTLNNVIDINKYSIPEAEKCGKEQRALGIGIQGLADTLAELDLNFESEEAKKLNIAIYEQIYYSALYWSNYYVDVFGVYPKFEGSPLQNGIFQQDMWRECGLEVKSGGIITDEQWNTLRENIRKNGLCNSLLTTQMPTASSASIIGSTEAAEPIESNLYMRRVLGGEYVILNKYLVKDLIELGLWTETLKNFIIADNGSLKNLQLEFMLTKENSTEENIKRCHWIKEKYKTAYEYKQKLILDYAIDRGPYVDQSQSMNLFMLDANVPKLTSCHFHSWKGGLKTGMYYLRTKAISTGAKHLAIDTVTLAERPTNSIAECFGCTS